MTDTNDANGVVEEIQNEAARVLQSWIDDSTQLGQSKRKVPREVLVGARDEIKRLSSMWLQTQSYCDGLTTERDTLKAELSEVKGEREPDEFLDTMIDELRKQLDIAKELAVGQCDFDTAAICRDTRDVLKRASECLRLRNETLRTERDQLAERVGALEASRELVETQVPYLLWMHIDDGMPDEHQEVCFIKRDGTKGFTHFKFGNEWYFKDNVEWWVPVIPDPQEPEDEALTKRGEE